MPLNGEWSVQASGRKGIEKAGEEIEKTFSGKDEASNHRNNNNQSIYTAPLGGETSITPLCQR